MFETAIVEPASRLFVEVPLLRIKSSLRSARSLIAALVEQIWLCGFALGRWLARPNVRRWSSPGGQRVLVVAPHPDDETIGCGGAISLHRAAGDTVCVAFITDGRRSRAFGLEPEEMASRREQEARAAARVLDVNRVAWLGLPEGAWSDEQAERALGVLIHYFVPELVYAPSRIDFHPEHYRVACALAQALSELPSDILPQVRVYQIQAPLTSILANLVADTTSVAMVQAAALKTYVTQVASTSGALRQRRYAAAFYGVAGQAEEFWDMPLERYVALHAAGQGWSSGAIRGLRRFPWSDPLAYLWGREERRQIVQQAGVWPVSAP